MNINQPVSKPANQTVMEWKIAAVFAVVIFAVQGFGMYFYDWGTTGIRVAALLCVAAGLIASGVEKFKRA